MMQDTIQCRQRPFCVAAALVVVTLATHAFGQTMQVYPVRSAPLGSPAGTIGDPVTPQFNAGLGCWEVEVSPGVEVDLDLQAFGWGDAPGSPTVGAIGGYVVSASYDNGVGGVLNPKGWPASPLDGAYQASRSCEGVGGTGLPCTHPFDPTCGQQGGGTCVTPSPRWMWQCNPPGIDLIVTPTLNYAWATAEGACGEIDDGTTRTFGGLILEVPLNAAGTYVIALNPDPNTSYMSAITGAPIPNVAFTSACITVMDNGEPGRCCSNIGPNVVCEEATASVCSTRPEPRSFVPGGTCEACPCPTCLTDGDCDDGDDCTIDSCEECGGCVHTLICPEMRFYPTGLAPLGSPAGTVGYDVTPEFNSTLGCWELEVIPGFEVHIEVQASNWGSAPGSPTLGAIQATSAPVIFSSGVGPDVVPKGWPDNPEIGIYMSSRVCIEGGNGDPCVPPFGDFTCDNSNGTCGPNPDWVMPPCADALSAFSPWGPGYAWAAAEQVDCNVDDGEIKPLGGMILEVPYDAQGTYLINFNTDPNYSSMVRWTGAPIENVQFTPACITIAAPDPPKNRYLTFAPREPGPVAYKLDMVSSLFHPDAVVSGWVGAPDTNGIASLEPAPVTREWTEAVVHITGCEITPVAEFELRASTDGGGTFLPPVSLKTIDQPTQSRWWGDVAGDFNGTYWTPPQGVTNIADVVAIRNQFQGRLDAPGLARTDVAPQEPNRIANIEDMLFVILAFKGELYPFGCPFDPCFDNMFEPCP